MRFYHRTTRAAAESIISTGFRDATSNYLTDTLHTGVWVSDQPLDENEGARSGEVLLAVDSLLDEAFFDHYEWREDGKPYREWLIPAAVINKHCTVAVVEE